MLPVRAQQANYEQPFCFSSNETGIRNMIKSYKAHLLSSAEHEEPIGGL
jgi:hypothetical protein